MSLHPQAQYVVPPETAKVAHAIFLTGNLCVAMTAILHEFFSDQHFNILYPDRGQPAISPVRLALATLLQYLEGSTDRQTADAVRSRIDWKYLLALELTNTGFHHSVLSEFRTRLYAVTIKEGSSELLVKRSRSEIDDDDFENSFLSHNKTLP